MAQRDDIDGLSLIHYIINGIKAYPITRYGCSNLPDFKQKFLIYEELCNSVPKFKPKTTHAPPDTPKFSPEEKS